MTGGLALLAACASSGPTANPFARTLEWFSYVGGDDIRAECRAGSPDRYRMVYNGNYLEQRRTYDVAPETGGSQAGGARIAGRVIGEANLASGIPLLDPLEPWRGAGFETRLDPGRTRALRETLDAAGKNGAAPGGSELPSDGFFWTAAVCRDGVFRFGAWAYPSPGFDSLGFPGILLESDTTGTPINRARTVDYLTLREKEEARRFVLKVGDNGLAPF
ncbi:MAG: hypothetical protein HQL33_07945 [Alphaproteobacteria bacterium]|nr:hypothetical protein [Alphaproteobacteria bacterium]MBF0129910.1 hypothetical protein [Alphaproteobacteria bacterium]